MNRHKYVHTYMHTVAWTQLLKHTHIRVFEMKKEKNLPPKRNKRFRFYFFHLKRNDIEKKNQQHTNAHTIPDKTLTVPCFCVYAYACALKRRSKKVKRQFGLFFFCFVYSISLSLSLSN